MIDEKKIEEAADKYAIDTYAFDEPVPTEYKEGIQEVFQTSINWFKKNLWHDASEEPNEDEKLLVERVRDGKRIYYSAYYKDGYYLSIDSVGYKNEAIKRDNKSRWFYIEDLMKGGK